MSSAAIVTIFSFMPMYHQAGLLVHYTALAEQAGLPIVLYNVPVRTGCDLLPDTVAQLRAHPQIIGIKEARGDSIEMPKDGYLGDYIREIAGANFTAKDFRTWHGTTHALALWVAQDEAKPAGVKQLLSEVAARLGNTVAVCRKAYVHPRVLAVLAKIADAQTVARLEKARRRAGLAVSERRLLAFLA